MKATLNKVMPHVFKNEGGYVNHPKDPGGATNMGITIGTLSAWRGKPVTKNDVRNLSRREATEIYRKRYWNPVRGDELPAGVDYAVFDFAINSGPRRAIEYLQRVLGVSIDRVIGPKTLAAASATDPKTVIRKLCAARLAYMQRIKNGTLWKSFGRGWQRRVDGVQHISLEMAGQRRFVPPAPTPAEPGTTHVEPSGAPHGTLFGALAGLFRFIASLFKGKG